MKEHVDALMQARDKAVEVALQAQRDAMQARSLAVAVVALVALVISLWKG